MKYDAQLFTLIKKEEIADGIFDFAVENSAIAQITRPGQFAHILVPGKTLRRPISVCDVQNGALRLVFEVKGEGTRLLSQTQVGQTLDILAPLGHGFSIEKTKKNCLCRRRDWRTSHAAKRKAVCACRCYFRLPQ